MSSVRVYYPRYDRAQVVGAIASGLAKLKGALPVKLLVLFGSYASGNYTVSSDIDLLVVYQGPRREEAYGLVRKALGIPGLEPHVYSQEEYAESKRVLDAMTAKGMVLYQEGGRDKAPMSRSKRVLRGLGASLMGVGLLLFVTTGAYYAYSYHSLNQLEEGAGDEPVQSPGQALLLESEDASSGLASFLAGSPGAAPAPPLTRTVGDDVPWESLAYWPLGILPAERIIIPSIDVDSRVVEVGIVFEEGEWQWERPKHAVGHLQGTADPGQPGNVVLSGHISSPIRGEGQVFKRLPEVSIGDVVVLYTPFRAFAYQVVAKKVVLPSEVSVLSRTTDETLTLITCVPDFIYTHRLIVTAKRVSSVN